MRNAIFGPLFDLELRRYTANKQFVKAALEFFAETCNELFWDHSLNELMDNSLETLSHEPSSYYGAFEDGSSVEKCITENFEMLLAHPACSRFVDKANYGAKYQLLAQMFQLRLIELMLTKHATLQPVSSVIHPDQVIINIQSEHRAYECQIVITDCNKQGRGVLANVQTQPWGEDLLPSSFRLHESKSELLNTFRQLSQHSSLPEETPLTLPIYQDPINWDWKAIQIFEHISSSESISQYATEYLMAIAKEVGEAEVPSIRDDDLRLFHSRLWDKVDDGAITNLANKLNETYLKDCSIQELLPALNVYQDAFSRGYGSVPSSCIRSGPINLHLEERYLTDPYMTQYPLSQPLLEDLLFIDQCEDLKPFMKKHIHALNEHNDNVQNYKASLDLAKTLEGIASPAIDEHLVQANTQTVDIDTIPIKGSM